MRTFKLSVISIVCAGVIFSSGCVSDLEIQNSMQRKRLTELESQLQATKLSYEQTQRQLDAAGVQCGVEKDALNQKLAALEEDLTKKKNLISSMEHQLLFGGVALPAELSTMLADFAKNQEMVTYDSARGIVKFKSDLLFDRGSDEVAPSALNAVKALCDILNSEQGKQFDIIIAGHTDDIRIGRAETRQKHPTNWHLSAHRAISVLELMAKDNLAEDRMSVRGFGELRPVEANKPNKQGNPLNRRVEIYIVPKGV